MTKTQDKSTLAADLASYPGSDQAHRHFTGLIYTGGIQLMAERCEAYWLIDAVASHVVTSRRLKREPFLVVRMVASGGSGSLSFHSDWNHQDSTEFPPIVSQDIPLTTFPLGELLMYCIDSVLMLPSEY
jgi:hypothetical protein